MRTVPEFRGLRFKRFFDVNIHGIVASFVREGLDDVQFYDYIADKWRFIAEGPIRTEFGLTESRLMMIRGDGLINVFDYDTQDAYVESWTIPKINELVPIV